MTEEENVAEEIDTEENSPREKAPSKKVPKSKMSETKVLEAKSKLYSDIQNLIQNEYPDKVISESAPELIGEMVILFMKEVMHKTHKKKRFITEQDLKDVVEQTPEYDFIRDYMKNEQK